MQKKQSKSTIHQKVSKNSNQDKVDGDEIINTSMNHLHQELFSQQSNLDINTLQQFFTEKESTNKNKKMSSDNKTLQAEVAEEKIDSPIHDTNKEESEIDLRINKKNEEERESLLVALSALEVAIEQLCHTYCMMELKKIASSEH